MVVLHPIGFHFLSKVSINFKSIAVLNFLLDGIGHVIPRDFYGLGKSEIGEYLFDAKIS